MPKKTTFNKPTEDSNERRLRQWLKPKDDEDLQRKVWFAAFRLDPTIDSGMFDPENEEHDRLILWAVEHFDFWDLACTDERYRRPRRGLPS